MRADCQETGINFYSPTLVIEYGTTTTLLLHIANVNVLPTSRDICYFPCVMYVCMYVCILKTHSHLTHYGIDNVSKVLCSEGQTGVKHLRLPTET